MFDHVITHISQWYFNVVSNLNPVGLNFFGFFFFFLFVVLGAFYFKSEKPIVFVLFCYDLFRQDFWYAFIEIVKRSQKFKVTVGLFAFNVLKK